MVSWLCWRYVAGDFFSPDEVCHFRQVLQLVCFLLTSSLFAVSLRECSVIVTIATELFHNPMGSQGRSKSSCSTKKTEEPDAQLWAINHSLLWVFCWWTLTLTLCSLKWNMIIVQLLISSLKEFTPVWNHVKSYITDSSERQMVFVISLLLSQAK